MTDLVQMRFFLGIEVIQRLDGIFTCQRKQAVEVLNRLGIENYNSVCNPTVPGKKIGKDENGAKVYVTLYKQIVGSLMYLTTTRLDLMLAVSLISRFMACPTQQHFAAGKMVLRYLKGTVDYGVFYKKGGVGDLTGSIGLLVSSLQSLMNHRS